MEIALPGPRSTAQSLFIWEKGEWGGGKVQLEVGKTPTPEKRWGDITERITEPWDWLPTEAVKSIWANFEDWNGEKP